MPDAIFPRGGKKRLLPIRYLVMAVAAVLILAIAACSDDDAVEVVLANIDRSPEKSIVIPAGEPVVIGGHRSIVSADRTGSAPRARVPGRRRRGG